MARPTLWKPRLRLHHLARDAAGGFPSDGLLRQIREHAELGERVRVRRAGFRSFDIARNGTLWLVLPVVGDPTPIGTYSNVCAAVLAGDAYVEAVRRGEFDAEDDDYPRGAA